MQSSATARLIGYDSATPPAKPQDLAILKAFKLLGAVAYEMTAQTIRVKTPTAEGKTEFVERPNFYRVARGLFPTFIEQVEGRCPGGDFQRNWRGLSALNAVLSHAVFDADAGTVAHSDFPIGCESERSGNRRTAHRRATARPHSVVRGAATGS